MLKQKHVSSKMKQYTCILCDISQGATSSSYWKASGWSPGYMFAKEIDTLVNHHKWAQF